MPHICHSLWQALGHEDARLLLEKVLHYKHLDGLTKPNDDRPLVRMELSDEIRRYLDAMPRSEVREEQVLSSEFGVLRQDSSEFRVFDLVFERYLPAFLLAGTTNG